MAKPDDTRYPHAPANANPGTTRSNNPGNNPGTIAIPATTNLTPILEALLARQTRSQAAPVPPRSARPARLKPRRRVTVSNQPALDAKLPWIRLCGHWLESAGFALHTRVRVHVAQGVLILIAEDES
jgi:hypothetical protein